MHEHVSAMEPPVVNNIQGWSRIPEGQPIYLDADGNPMVESEMDAATRQLLEDYQAHPVRRHRRGRLPQGSRIQWTRPSVRRCLVT